MNEQHTCNAKGKKTERAKKKNKTKQQPEYVKRIASKNYQP